MNEVAEDRLEMLVPRAQVGEAVSALREAHPYEEPAFDLIGLERADGWGRLGLGRVGELEAEGTVGDLAARCAEALGATPRIVGDADRRVRRVALCGGSGMSLHRRARAAGADVFVTGDVKYHDALDAASAGLAVIDAGHLATEWPWVEDQVSRLQEWFPQLTVASATRQADPFSGGAA